MNAPSKERENNPSFLSDVQTLRKRARQHIEAGAVTASYDANRDTVLKLLNEALATELVCVLRYKRHYYMAQGIHSESIKQEFGQHALEEQGHADKSPGASCSSAVSPTSHPKV